MLCVSIFSCGNLSRRGTAVMCWPGRPHGGRFRVYGGLCSRRGDSSSADRVTSCALSHVKRGVAWRGAEMVFTRWIADRAGCVGYPERCPRRAAWQGTARHAARRRAACTVPRGQINIVAAISYLVVSMRLYSWPKYRFL